MAINPPVPPSFATLSSTICAASCNFIPRYSISAEMSCATTERIKYSPSPVAETAQVALFAYVPPPMMGESPTRPAFLFVVPPVEVAAARLPFLSSATAPTVPCRSRSVTMNFFPPTPASFRSLFHFLQSLPALFGVKILLVDKLNAVRRGERLRAFAVHHHVSRFLHHQPRQVDRILDVFQTGDRKYFYTEERW